MKNTAEQIIDAINALDAETCAGVARVEADIALEDSLKVEPPLDPESEKALASYLYTEQQERFAGGGANGWNRVTVAGEIRDCGEDAENLDTIREIEARGHIAVQVTIANESEIREYVDDASEAAAQEAFWRCRAAEKGIRL